MRPRTQRAASLALGIALAVVTVACGSAVDRPDGDASSPTTTSRAAPPTTAAPTTTSAKIPSSVSTIIEPYPAISMSFSLRTVLDDVPDDTVDAQPGEPFNILFNPDVQRAALARQQATTESGPQTGNVVGLNNDDLVGPAGLEPTTFPV